MCDGRVVWCGSMCCCEGARRQARRPVDERDGDVALRSPDARRCRQPAVRGLDQSQSIPALLLLRPVLPRTLPQVRPSPLISRTFSQLLVVVS